MIPLMPCVGRSFSSPMIAPRRRWRRKRVDALTDLICSDPKIERDAKTLRKLRHSARRSIGTVAARSRSKIAPTLYRRYRGTDFPVTKADGSALEAWRYLTPWMKTQVAALCLEERKFMQFTVHFHDELLAELKQAGSDLQVYFRDRLSRCLRERFGELPWFLFVIENRTKSGKSIVRPHFHGCIEIRRAPLPFLKNGLHSMRHRMTIVRHGTEGAELGRGKELVHEALDLASGNSGDRAFKFEGRSQVRNVWVHPPYHALFNPQWIDYAFKNTIYGSRLLGEHRWTMSLELQREAQRLWRLIREGESALAQWGYASPP